MTSLSPQQLTEEALNILDCDDANDESGEEQGNDHSIQEKVGMLAHLIGKQLNADFVVYSGNIGSPADIHFRKTIVNNRIHKTVILWLSTYGGIPDSAFRMAKALQNTYDRVICVVDRQCKSSGTLMTLGADEIWMTDEGELGPLDIQLLNKEEFQERNSGLDSLQALDTLSEQSASLFSNQFLNIRMGGRISTKQALDVAGDLTVGLMSKIYGQLEPLKLGEISRSMRIAFDYGQRLNKGNLKDNALQNLIAGYPSHSYVIDFNECKDRLFNSVKIIDNNFVDAAIGTLSAIVDSRVGSTTPLILHFNEYLSCVEFNTKEEQELTSEDDGQDPEPCNESAEPQESEAPDSTEEEDSQLDVQNSDETSMEENSNT